MNFFIKGYTIFALQHGGWCAGTSDSTGSFMRFGEADNCQDGTGGAMANDVYLIQGIDLLDSFIFLFKQENKHIYLFILKC